MNSNDFNNQNPDFLSSNGFKNYNNMLSSQEIIFYYPNSRFLWKELMKINTSYIFKSKDISLLEPYTENILYSRLNPDDIDLLSKEYIEQLVTLLQLAGQYLVYTQKRLEFENQELKDKVEEMRQSSQNNQKYKILIENLNRQNQEKDFLIKTYQTMGYSMSNRKNNKIELNSDNNLRGKNDRYSETENKIYQCKICTGKKFKSKKYLDDHMQRRHSDIIEAGKERHNNGDNIREEFDRKLNSMTDYLTKMVKDNLENIELYKINKKLDNLQNDLFTKNGRFEQNMNSNQINPVNINTGKYERYKNCLNEIKILRDEFNKERSEITNIINNEKKTLKAGENNNFTEAINSKRNNTKHKTHIQKGNYINNINEKENINDTNNQKREALKDKEDDKKKDDNKKKEEDKKNEKKDNINHEKIDKNKNSREETENKTKTELLNTNEINKDSKEGDKKIELNHSTHNLVEVDVDEQNILKDINPNNNIDNKSKKEEDKIEKVESGDIYEIEESKDQSANFFFKDNINELKDSKTKKNEPKKELIEFKENMDKRDNDFYNNENEDYEIIEIPSKFNANNKEIDDKIENKLKDGDLNQFINNYEINCKNEKIKGISIYKILEIDNILKEYKEYMEEKNKNENQKENINEDNKKDDKKVYNIKNSDVFSSQVQNHISVENKNPYNNKDDDIHKKNLMESSIQLLEQNFEKEISNPKKSINQNVIIGHKIT